MSVATMNHAHESSISDDLSMTEHEQQQSCPIWFWILGSISVVLLVGGGIVGTVCLCSSRNSSGSSSETTVPENVSIVALPVVGQTGKKHAAWLVPVAKPKASLTTTMADVAVLDLVPSADGALSNGLTLVDNISGKPFANGKPFDAFAEFTSPVPKADSPSTTQWIDDMDAYMKVVFGNPDAPGPGAVTRVIFRVSFTIKSDVDLNNFSEELQKVVQGTSKEEGCGGYQLFKVDAAERSFVMFESFKSMGDQRKHMTKDYMDQKDGAWGNVIKMMVGEKPPAPEKFFVYVDGQK